MARSLWLDPLQDQPEDATEVWVRVRSADREPLLATWAAAAASFSFLVGSVSVELSAVDIVAWRPQ